VLHLKGRVVEPKALAEKILELESDPVAVPAGLHQHVGGQGRKATRDRPDVQVMRLHHTGVLRDRPAHVRRWRRLRGRLEEDTARLLQQRVAPQEHEAGHEQRGHGVEPSR